MSEILGQTELKRLGDNVLAAIREFVDYALDAERRRMAHCEGLADTIRRRNAEISTLKPVPVTHEIDARPKETWLPYDRLPREEIEARCRLRMSTPQGQGYRTRRQLLEMLKAVDEMAAADGANHFSFHAAKNRLYQAAGERSR